MEGAMSIHDIDGLIGIVNNDNEEIRQLRARVAQLEEEDRQWEKLSLVEISEENDRLRSIVRELVGALEDNTANLSLYCGLTEAERKDVLRAKEILSRVPEELRK
jgi:hypothetical protein